MHEQLVVRTEDQPLGALGDGRHNANRKPNHNSTSTRRTLYITMAASLLLIVAAFISGWAISNANSTQSAAPAQPAQSGGAGTAQSAVGLFMGPTNSNTPYDLRFIDSMITHHEGAIISVQAMITNSTHPELRDLGSRIVKVQQQQIEQMLTWRQQWYTGTAPLNTANTDMGMDMMSGGTLGGWMMGSGTLTGTDATAPYNWMMGGGMMGRGMMGGNNNGSSMMGGGLASGDQAGLMFLRMMIPHHQMAIDMSQDALKNAQHPELKTLAQSIISGQSAETTEMEGYLKVWYNEDSTRNLAAPMEQMMSRMGR